MTVKLRIFASACLALCWVMGAHAQTPTVPASKTAGKTALPTGGCSVAEFRALAQDSVAPQERGAQAMQWLLRNGLLCSEEQIMAIRANRALWLGTADSVEIMRLVDRIAEVQLAGRADALHSLYGSPTPERAATVEVYRASGGMRPVLPASPPLPPMVLGIQLPAPVAPTGPHAPAGAGAHPRPPAPPTQ